MTNTQTEDEAIRDFELMLAELDRCERSERIKRALAQKTKVAVYLRASSDTQQESSMETQMAALRQFAKEHNFWITAIYKDYGSTRTPKRPGLSRLLQKVFHGSSVKKVLCWSMDRISRNPAEAKQISDFLNEKGVEIVTP